MDDLKASESIAGLHSEIASALQKMLTTNDFQGVDQNTKGQQIPKGETDRVHDLRLIQDQWNKRGNPRLH